MTELLTLIEESRQDTEKLLEYYAASEGSNQSLVKGMQNDPRKRDEYIHYEIWKMIPIEDRAKYNQDLTLKVETEEEKTPLKEKKEKKTTVPEESIPEKKEPTEDFNEDIVRKGKLYNQRAVLSNSLIIFDESDNEGRKKVVEGMDAIDKEIQAINEKLSGGTPPAKHKFLKTAEEKANLTPAEITVYKKKLSEKRSRTKKDLLEHPDSPHKEKWEYTLELINQEYNSL